MQLRISDKIQEADQTVTLVLDATGRQPGYRAGQFLTFIFNRAGMPEIRRSYSLSSAPEVDEHLAVTVKRIPNGAVSRYLVDEAQVGETLEVLHPAGQFVVDTPASTPRDLFLIGGGSGITPLFSILKFVLHHDPLTRVFLLDANRNEGATLFLRPLCELAAQFPERFFPFLFWSEPQGDLGDLRRQWAPLSLRWGRLSNALIEDWVNRHRRRDPVRSEFFLCGPPGLLLKAENTLGFMGFSPEHIHREIFTIRKPYQPPSEWFSDSHVAIQLEKESIRFPLRGGQTILEAAREAGHILPFSCGSGSCTTCSFYLRKGRVEMFTQSGRIDSEATRGLVLTCVGYPASPEVELVWENPR